MFRTVCCWFVGFMQSLLSSPHGGYCTLQNHLLYLLSWKTNFTNCRKVSSANEPILYFKDIQRFGILHESQIKLPSINIILVWSSINCRSTVSSHSLALPRPPKQAKKIFALSNTVASNSYL